MSDKEFQILAQQVRKRVARTIKESKVWSIILNKAAEKKADDKANM